MLDKWPEREQRQAARAEREAARAEREAARAEQEAARADREAALRLEAERELAELRRLLQRSGDSPSSG